MEGATTSCGLRPAPFLTSPTKKWFCVGTKRDCLLPPLPRTQYTPGSQPRHSQRCCGDEHPPPALTDGHVHPSGTASEDALGALVPAGAARPQQDRSISEGNEDRRGGQGCWDPQPSSRTAAGSQGSPTHPSCLVVRFLFFKTSWNLSISPIPAYTQTQPREQTKMPESQIRDKAEGERAACSRCPHLTPRWLYLGTATVCGAAAPSGTAQNADFPDNRPQQLRQNH